MLNTKSDHPLVKFCIKHFVYVKLPLGIKPYKRSEFLPITNVTISDKGKLFHIINSEKKYVSTYIKEISGLQTARWLNHLYFKDGNEDPEFNKFIKELM